MARGAGHICVTRRQRKSSRVVIERRGRPADGGVARRAIRNSEGCSRRRMHGIRGGLPGG